MLNTVTYLEESLNNIGPDSQLNGFGFCSTTGLEANKTLKT